MSEEPEQLMDMWADFYNDDPKVGDIVLIRHNFEHCNIAGEVVGMRRFHPHRGYDPAHEYELVVYQEVAIKLAGIKGWFKIGVDHNWSLVQILDDPEYRKLGADVVLASKVEDFIAATEEEDDEL